MKRLPIALRPRQYALLFDQERDILFLQDPPRTLDSTGGTPRSPRSHIPTAKLVIASLNILLRGCPIPLSSLRRLAITYDTWRKIRDLGRLGLVRRFWGLEALYVSFLADDYKGNHRATWSDILLGGLWSHVEEVEKEVREDVAYLKREDSEWNVPKVRVVGHRGVLEEQLVSEYMDL
jgi:hypothetical protein